MEFDKDKCLKLLKERTSLKNEGKSLRDYDKAKNDELIGYLKLLEDQIFWKSRKQYFQILELFGKKKITLDQFFEQFCGLRGSNLKAVKMWEENLEAEAGGILTQSNQVDIHYNSKSCGFIKIISHLHSLVDLCDPDITFEMNLKHPELIGYGISEEFLRLRIKEYFLPKIKEYC